MYVCMYQFLFTLSFIELFPHICTTRVSSLQTTSVKPCPQLAPLYPMLKQSEIADGSLNKAHPHLLQV